MPHKSRPQPVSISAAPMPALLSLLSAFAVCSAIAASTPAAFAQSPNTKNTLKLDDPARRFPASIKDMSWLAGTWQVEAFGETAEEVWTEPSAGTMVGLFKLMRGGKASMYEIELIVEEAGSLALWVRHFNADFTAWEEKDQFVRFPLVKLTDDAVYFQGLTFRRLGPDLLKVYLSIEIGGKVREEELIYNRVRKAS